VSEESTPEAEHEEGPEEEEEQGPPPIVARCLHCGARTEHPRAEAGNKIDCPECGSPRRIPDVEQAQRRAVEVSKRSTARESTSIERRFVIAMTVFGGSFLLLAVSASLTARPDLPGIFGDIVRGRFYIGGFGAVFFACGVGFHATRHLAFAYLASVFLALVIFSPVILIPVLVAQKPDLRISPRLLGQLLVLPLIALGPLQSVYTLAHLRKRAQEDED
jgi:hypothetical protein